MTGFCLQGRGCGGFFTFIVVIVLWMATREVQCIKWLALGSGEAPACSETALGPCWAVPHVAHAARLARGACRALLATRRWDCSSVERAPDFGPDLLLGTKEQSFVYALSSAALMYTMAKACSSGELFSCSCGLMPRERPRGDFKWGGCSDNLRWASRFVRHFAEAPERTAGQLRPERERRPKRIQIFDSADRRVDSGGNPIDATPAGHRDADPTSQKTKTTRRQEDRFKIAERQIKSQGNISLAVDLPIPTVDRETTVEKGRKKGKSVKRKKKAERIKTNLQKKLERLQPYIALANLENSRLGRKSVERSLSVQCKCHGVSGSCSVRTCWRALRGVRSLGASLLAPLAAAAPLRALAARAARPRARPRRGPPALVFVSRSPDYCTRDASTGSDGTAGRLCNATLRSGEESCRHMCCGRGHRTELSETRERCNCRYVWCCRVDCDVCEITTETHRCN